MAHRIHGNHDHVHGAGCGHTQIRHGNHSDFIHDGHLHSIHDSHIDECLIAVDDNNPAICREVACLCGHESCGHEKVPHGDHYDFLVDGRLHFHHDGHCDDHGAVEVVH